MAEKFTDKEIIKALENLLFNRKCKIAKSGEQFITLGDILDLINRQQAEIEDARIGVKSYKGKYKSAVKTAKELQILVDEQQAEIERLTVNMNAFGLGMKREKERADTTRAEAIKEFAEKLKDASYESDLYDRDERWVRGVTIDDIDTLVKEMVGEDK